MRILHLTHTDPRTDNRILKQLASISSIDAYTISVVGLNLDEGAQRSNKKIKANIKIVNLYFDLPRSFPRVLRHTLLFLEMNFRFFFLALKLKPHVIHCHDTMVLPIGFILKLFRKSILIYDAHELESNKNGQTPFLSKATFLIEKLCWSRIDELISVSESILAWYINHLGPKSNTLILNSPDLESNVKVESNYFNKLFHIPKDTLIFIYLGILGNGRGISNILDAFAKHELKSHVVFVGYGDLSAKIKELSLSTANIHYHNPVPHEDVVALVSNADYGFCLVENVSLSDYYCLPNKLFEYTFAGLPILASDFPEMKKVILKYNLGKICDNSVNSIVNIVKELEQNTKLAIDSDLSELSWQKQSERLLSLYLKFSDNISK